MSPDTEQEIHALGFERYIHNYIENDTMAFNPQFYQERGADDDEARRGSTPVGTARRLAELTFGAERCLIPNTKHMTFWDGKGGLKTLEEFLLRHPIGTQR